MFQAAPAGQPRSPAAPSCDNGNCHRRSPQQDHRDLSVDEATRHAGQSTEECGKPKNGKHLLSSQLFPMISVPTTATAPMSIAIQSTVAIPYRIRHAPPTNVTF